MQYTIGDRVIVTHDNYGGEATIIDTRDDDASTAPASHYKVRMDTGQEFWAFDFELCDRATIDRVRKLFMQKLAAEYPDHPWLKRGE